MKKLLSFLAAIVVAITMFSSCNQSPAEQLDNAIRDTAKIKQLTDKLYNDKANIDTESLVITLCGLSRVAQNAFSDDDIETYYLYRERYYEVYDLVKARPDLGKDYKEFFENKNDILEFLPSPVQWLKYAIVADDTAKIKQLTDKLYNDKANIDTESLAATFLGLFTVAVNARGDDDTVTSDLYRERGCEVYDLIMARPDVDDVLDEDDQADLKLSRFCLEN